MCLRVLSERSQLLADVFGEQSRSVFAKMLQVREQEAKTDKKVRINLLQNTFFVTFFGLQIAEEEEGVNIHADQLINFLQLAGQRDEIGENKYELSLLTATAGGSTAVQKEGDKFSSQLNKVRAL